MSNLAIVGEGDDPGGLERGDLVDQLVQGQSGMVDDLTEFGHHPAVARVAAGRRVDDPEGPADSVGRLGDLQGRKGIGGVDHHEQGEEAPPSRFRHRRMTPDLAVEPLRDHPALAGTGAGSTRSREQPHPPKPARGPGATGA
ncbi:MAG: hypothetical protein WBW80_02550 [Acidimicrobiales bacterium]